MFLPCSEIFVETNFLEAVAGEVSPSFVFLFFFCASLPPLRGRRNSNPITLGPLFEVI